MYLNNTTKEKINEHLVASMELPTFRTTSIESLHLL